MDVLNPALKIDIPDLTKFDLRFSGTHSPAVPVFDFDGVLCAPDEDAVYKLPERPKERDLLTTPAQHYGIDYELYDIRYLRHLVLQAILAEREIDAKPGPLFDLACELSAKRRPFFVLTARSGIAAINRAISFLNKHDIAPQEVFFVGRVPKGRQLAVVRHTVPAPSLIVYYDDNLRHSKNSKMQEIPGLETVYVDWSRSGASDADALLANTLEWFAKRRAGRRAA